MGLKDSPNQIQEPFWIFPEPLTMIFPVIQIKSGKWDIYLDELSSIGKLTQREYFFEQVLDLGWLLVLLPVRAGLGSGGGAWYGGGPSGLWPKSGHMKEKGKEGAVGGRLGKRSMSSGGGSGTSITSVEESPHHL